MPTLQVRLFLEIKLIFECTAWCYGLAPPLISITLHRHIWYCTYPKITSNNCHLQCY